MPPTTPRIYWPSTDTNRAVKVAGFLDELEKIGAAAEGQTQKSPAREAVRTAVISALGTATGAAGAEVIARQLAKMPVTENKIRAVKIILPILTGAAVILGNELRKMKGESYSKVPGYKEPADGG